MIQSNLKRWVFFGLIGGLLSGCGSRPPLDLSPVTLSVKRLQMEAEALARDETSKSHLETSRALLTAADAWAGELPEAAVPLLEESEAAARVAIGSAVASRRAEEAEDCLTATANARREWQDAVRLLEQTEKVSGREARGVGREPIPETVMPPLPPFPLSPADSVMAPDALRSLADAWGRLAGEREVPAADLETRIDRSLSRARAIEIAPDDLDHHLRAAAWPILEMGYRVQADASRRQCLSASDLALQYNGRRDHALWSMVELERGVKEGMRAELEKERERMADREQALYESLKQFEGQFATIRREARGTILSLSDILFDFDKATLRREAEFNLVKVATIFQQFPEMGIEIEGHTDNIGTEEYNLKLSERRATAVYTFLNEQGVPAERLKTEGFGASQPVESNAAPEGRQANRRVDLVIAEQ